MSVSVDEINELRQQTGAGMMDCKEALEETGGDFDEAVAFLRKKGQKVAAKRADKATTEGLIEARTSEDKKKGILVNIGSETDFVAKNEEFQELAQKVADIAIESYPDSKDKLLDAKDGELTLKEKIDELTGKLGERLELSDYQKLEGKLVVPYIHAGNTIGVLVSLNKSDETAQEVGRDLAMQIAAMDPLSIDKDGVDEKYVKEEKEVAKEQAEKEGKPDHIIEKIVEGKLNKFYNQNTLLNQPFVKDEDQSVRQMLEDADKDLEVQDFKRVALG